MATRQSEGHELAGLCRRVGWPVRKVLDGWRVTFPDGTAQVIHLTVSDRNGYKATRKDLDEKGLSEALAEVERREERERQERLAADRAANDRLLQQAEKRASALALAAGPYAPTQITLDDLLADHPAPRVFHRVPITPQMAEALLERNNPRPGADWPNRPIRRGDLTEWCTVLRTGRWRYTHQGVALDVDGRLQDGQHRLAAIADTGITAEMMVSVGMPRDNFAVIDVGRRRSAAQVLTMVGASRSSTMAAAARLIHLYDVWGAAMLDRARDRLSNDVVADVWSKLDHDLLDVAVREAYRLRAEIGCAVAGVTAAFYIIRRAVSDQVLVDAFTAALVDGVDRNSDAPVYVVRRNLTRQAAGVSRRLSPAQQMALIVKAWNACVQGRTAKAFYVTDGSPMPSVVIPTPEDND